VFGLSCFGHGKAVDIQPRLLAAWTKILLAEVMHYCSENHIELKISISYAYFAIMHV